MQLRAENRSKDRALVDEVNPLACRGSWSPYFLDSGQQRVLAVGLPRAIGCWALGAGACGQSPVGGQGCVMGDG